jgi:putative mRNA 3-end processing factor
MTDLVVVRKEGLYCVPGRFYIDPWRPVERAVITHAHADHARTGHGHYLAAAPGAGILRAAQVRLEHKGEVWVASGDYKVEADGTCAPFEPVRCDTFITESTFGMPIYRWQPQADIYAGINDWWRANAEQGRASVLYCYSFGKAQRILHGIDASIGPIICHGAAEPLNQVYREAGVALPPTLLATDVTDKSLFKRALVIAPPAAGGSSWIKRFGDYSDAFASGWMQVRGARRRRSVDRGFVLSDHADWPGLMQAIGASGAPRVIVTHGQIPTMVRWLQQNGLEAGAFETEYGAEDGNETAKAADPGEGREDGASDGLKDDSREGAKDGAKDGANDAQEAASGDATGKAAPADA